MKIALLAPAGAMHRYNGDFHKALHYAPITLTLLAALVPEELNAEVKIYDETAEKIPLDLEADVVGITCITGTADRCYRYADYFRQKGMTVLMGGPHVSILPEEALAHADCVMVEWGMRASSGSAGFPERLPEAGLQTESNMRLRRTIASAERSAE